MERKLLVSVLFFFFVLSLGVVAKEKNQTIEHIILVGTSKGDSVKKEIIDNTISTIFDRKPSLRFSVPVGANLNLKNKKETKEKFSISMGLGYYYGGIGANIEYSIFEYIGVFGCCGLAHRSSVHYLIFFRRKNLGYSFGARIYPMRKNKDFRPRIGISYGYNGHFRGRTYVYGLPVTHENITEGISVSLGGDFVIYKKLGFSLDFIIPITKSGELYFQGMNMNLHKNKILYQFSFGIRYSL